MEIKSKRVFFVGSRWPVLEQVLSLRMTVVKILTSKGSYLSKELNERGIKYDFLVSKASLVEMIKSTEFDFFLSNGCPYILPISDLKRGNKLFINVHPSYLPGLRGGSPVNGAILFNKQLGASCHYMDDGIDTGYVISRVKVDRDESTDLGLLYQLCFLAEAEVFTKAYERNFAPLAKQNINLKSDIYYTRKESDMMLDFRENVNVVLRKIKAFGVPSQGASFSYQNTKYRVLGARYVTNKFLTDKLNKFENGEIIFKYDNNLVLKLGEKIVHFSEISGDMDLFKKGDNILK